MAGATVTHKGKYFELGGAKVALPVGSKIAPPPLWFGGSSEGAIEVAAKHVQTYLSWGETPDQMAEKVKRVKEKASIYGRKLEYGIRLYVIVRKTDEKAWKAAAELYEHMDEAAIIANQKHVSVSDSVGQQRMNALHRGIKPPDLRELEIAPNLWAGIGLIRSGPGTAIVGSPETVIRTIEAYQAVGVDTFILSGMPLLEEAYRFGELVLPRLPVKRQASHGKNFTWSTAFARDTSDQAEKPLQTDA